MRLLLVFFLLTTALRQEGPYRRQIGEDGKTVVKFGKAFTKKPKCMVAPDRVRLDIPTLESVTARGPIGAGFDVTCYGQ